MTPWIYNRVYPYLRYVYARSPLPERGARYRPSSDNTHSQLPTLHQQSLLQTVHIPLNIWVAMVYIPLDIWVAMVHIPLNISVVMVYIPLDIWVAMVHIPLDIWVAMVHIPLDIWVAMT